jgi:hypothetical protein
VRDALATLPWVEQKTIQADRATKTAKFGVNDKAAFDLSEIEGALSSKYRRGLRVVDGPS